MLDQVISHLSLFLGQYWKFCQSRCTSRRARTQLIWKSRHWYSCPQHVLDQTFDSYYLSNDISSAQHLMQFNSLPTNLSLHWYGRIKAYRIPECPNLEERLLHIMISLGLFHLELLISVVLVTSPPKLIISHQLSRFLRTRCYGPSNNHLHETLHLEWHEAINRLTVNNE